MTSTRSSGSQPPLPSGTESSNPRQLVNPRRVAARRVVAHAATVAANAIAAADGAEPLPDPDEDTELDDETPAPTPMPVASHGPRIEPVSAAISEMPAPPDDPLAAMEHLFRMLVRSADEAARDSSIPAAARRRELRTISVAAERLLPRARVYKAEQTIIRNNEKIKAKAEKKNVAKMTPRPASFMPPKPETDDFG